MLDSMLVSHSAWKPRDLNARVCAVTLLALAVEGCGTKTAVSNEWLSETYSEGPMRRILVVGIASSDLGRRTYEDHFATALSAHEVEAVSSYTLLPTAQRISEQDLDRAVAEKGFDGVIATRLLGTDTETTFVPPSTRTVPGSTVRRPYGGYYGYYGRTYDVVHTPGYTTTKEIVRIETRLWSSGDGDLVWGLVSETFDPESTDDVIESVTDRITDQLAEDGLIPQ
jgi:hypothetical protein